MTFCRIFEMFLSGFFSALGAFVPVFLVMYGHFVFRKYAYKKHKKLLMEASEAQEMIIKISENALKNIYASVGTENLEGLMNRYDLEKSRYVKLISLANEHLDHIIKGRKKLIEVLMDISYIENYNFKIYFGTLLDKRFPDKNFKKESG